MILLRFIMIAVLLLILGYVVYRAFYSFTLAQENEDLQHELDVVNAKLKAYEDTNPTADWDNF